MEAGKVTGGISLVSILAVQAMLSNRPLLATITNLCTSTLCLGGYLGSLALRREDSSLPKTLSHTSSFAFLALLSGWRTMANF